MDFKFYIAFFSILLLISYSNTESVKKSYNGYKVFHLLPHNSPQFYNVEVLLQDLNLDFWTKRSSPGQNWRVMVPPKELQLFEQYMEENNIKYTEVISNVDDLINKTISKTINISPLSNFNEYHDYKSINKYINDLPKKTDKVTLLDLGETFEKRKIIGVKIGHNNKNDNAGILITSGLSAREWIGPAAALYIIDQLIQPINELMYHNVDWYIIPLVNPDGYEYSRKYDRMWRKNRAPGANCTGTDITKNFPFHFQDSGSAVSDHCSPEFTGYFPFSETETRVFLKFFNNTTDKNIKLYLSLRSFGPMLLYPWTFTSKPVENREELEILGEEVTSAMGKFRGTNYKVGPYLYELHSSGGVDTDWMKGVQNISLVYSLHIPARGSTFFDPVETEIKSLVEEVFEGIQIFRNYILQEWN